MDIRRILQEYDALFCQSAPDEIHAFLAEHISEARAEDDKRALLALLNEQIGYARDTDRRDIALHGCDELRTLLHDMGLEGTLPYGKSLLNIANVTRRFGLYQESLAAFRDAESAYRANLKEGDYEFAALYNNWSLLEIALHELEPAAGLIRRAIAVIDRCPDAVIEQATSRANLAVVLVGLAKDTGQTDLRTEAYSVLEKSIGLFEQAGGEDYHYSGALAALADMQLDDHNYSEAAANYGRSIRIIRMYMGDNQTVKDLGVKKDYALARASDADAGR